MSSDSLCIQVCLFSYLTSYMYNVCVLSTVIAMVSSTRGDAVVVTLLEEDIEGALLEEPLKTKTIPQVHWWLLCHGIKASLNDTKPALLKRYGK